tara:strand:- start:7244 stop:7678 length:435 start_codon:yes stop_codon:yes gene_type:complete
MIKSIFGAVLTILFLTLNFSFSLTDGDMIDNEILSTDDRIYELRTYVTHPGKLDDLHKRFSNHTLQLFARHGMVNVGYWIPVDQENTLIYILSHKSRESAEASWDSFINDPEWRQVYEESHADGPIVKEIESVFMKGAPYSQIR